MQTNANPTKKIVILGFGSIGQAIIPLLKDHFGHWDIWIIEKSLDSLQTKLAQHYGLHAIEATVTPESYQDVLPPLLRPGDFLLNLATSISSRALILLARASGAFYVDTCIDPWAYSLSQHGIDTSNYSLREQVLELREASAGASTAVVAHGANPGFVSILVKQALVEMATKAGILRAIPESKNDWARLARDLDVRVIQISERDTQVGTIPRSEGEFVCTWSVDGFVTECLQPVELGWGTHEAVLPERARRYDYGCKAAITIDRPCFTVKVKSWSPNYLDFEAFLITHNEAISIADYLTYREHEVVAYRPTCYYAYHPCDEAVASMELLRGATASAIRSTRVLKDEISSGIDELGVFVLSAKYPSLWLGSNLSIGKARKMARHNNATSLQVVSSLVAAMAWALEHPRAGIVESEDLDYRFIYEIAQAYWSPIVQSHLRWSPGPDADALQFSAFLVT